MSDDTPGTGTASVPNEAALRDSITELGLFDWLNISLTELSSGRAVLEVPYDEKYANLSSGTMHGGVTATILDTASGFALRSLLADPSDANLTTTDLNIRYLRPVRSDLRVVADVVRAGTTMGVTECKASVEYNGERKMVATGGTTYRLFRAES
jgi:uncharacterized protein (TIGR00369 family)